jgi:predicted GH43/DUF377 family glycosyl hydrolase
MCLLIALSADYAAAAETSFEFRCEEVVSRSFPPNLNWLHFGQPGFDALLYPTFALGQWVEYVLQIPSRGTYQITAHAVAGNACGRVQLAVNGDIQGDPEDLFADSRTAVTFDCGTHTFPKPGKAIFRIRVDGKNLRSQGYQVEFASFGLTRVDGFGLICPNGAVFAKTNPVFQWADLGPDFRYTLYLDDAPKAATKSTFLEANQVAAGEHHWYVVAETSMAQKRRSNCFFFTVGKSAPYPDREFSDDFQSGDLSNYVNRRMSLDGVLIQGKSSLAGSTDSLIYVKDVRMGAGEGEVSAIVRLDEPNSSASVGFTAADGTRIRATVDSGSGSLSLERVVDGYSIFEITPKAYQLPQWKENRTPEGAYIWQIASTAAALRTGSPYRLKLAYSKRSCAVMASLTDVDGSNLVTLRDLVDINLPDHPMMEVGQGKAHFGRLTYRRLNRLVYPWDIDTNQVVMRPGPEGSWDSRGVLNSAVVVRDNRWYMVYRGNPIPAPPNNRPDSELGVATSTDGVHWADYAENPIIRRGTPRDSKEDPDLLQPAGTNTYYLEYVSHAPVHKEVMASSTDGLHYSEPWDMNVKGKIGGMIDTHNEPQIPEFNFGGQKYRYLGTIEEGGIYLSNDLHQWLKMGVADYRGHPDRWCDAYECAGDIVVDADRNLRVETQAGTRVNGKSRISGNRLCTNVEDALSGSDPTKVLWRGDLPWLPDFYGDAPTGDLNEMTSTNGSVFPGQTVIKDGFLWHYYGGNNTFVGLIKAVYRPVFTYRDLRVLPSGGQAQSTTVEVTVRNEGSFSGDARVDLLLDGSGYASKSVTLGRDEESSVSFPISVPKGRHWLSIDDLCVGVEGECTR